MDIFNYLILNYSDIKLFIFSIFGAIIFYIALRIASSIYFNYDKNKLEIIIYEIKQLRPSKLFIEFKSIS